MTLLNPQTETIDLFKAFCPNCGPNHCLDYYDEGARADFAWCAECGWEGTCGDLLDLLAELDE